MYRHVIKRILDFIAALLLLIILLIPIIIIAILVRIKLGAPVIFKQRRPGKNNKLFSVYKFRSMTNEVDENGELLPDEMRLTKFGNFLRKSSFDELPQLFNILVGHMSFIGPRPKEIKDVLFMKHSEPLVRQAVRPGLSGLAQVNGRNGIGWDKVLEYDLYYVRNLSFWLDVKIFFKTFGVVFSRKGIDVSENVTHYLYPEYLLMNGKISPEEFSEKMQLANDIEKNLNKKYLFGRKTKFTREELGKKPKKEKQKKAKKQQDKKTKTKTKQKQQY